MLFLLGGLDESGIISRGVDPASVRGAMRCRVL